MTQFLPDNLLKLFAPRPPLPFLPPVDELSIDKKKPPPQGLAQYVPLFETKTEPAPEPPKIPTKEEKRAQRRKEKEELLAYKLEQQIAMWNPTDNENATSDPYRTLFVARLNYETSESKLRREFEVYGKISKIIMPADKDGKPRGYAFIEYSHKSEMSQAYKKADGIKIDGRRIVVDYERGRTNKAWLPRRLGGGKGDTRKAREPRALIEAREEEFYGSGGFSGSNGGGFRSGGDRGFGGGGGFRDDRPRERFNDRGGADRNGGGGGGGYRHRSREREDRHYGSRDRDERPSREGSRFSDRKPYDRDGGDRYKNDRRRRD